MPKHRLFVDEPVFWCEEHRGEVVQSCLRLWQRDKTWPELMVCPACEKKLKTYSMQHNISKAYFILFPTRFTQQDRKEMKALEKLEKRSLKKKCDKIQKENRQRLIELKREIAKTKRRTKVARAKAQKVRAAVKKWEKSVMKRTRKAEQRLRRSSRRKNAS